MGSMGAGGRTAELWDRPTRPTLRSSAPTAALSIESALLYTQHSYQPLSVLESPCNQDPFPCSLCGHHVGVSSAPVLPFTTSPRGCPVDRRLFQAQTHHSDGHQPAPQLYGTAKGRRSSAAPKLTPNHTDQRSQGSVFAHRAAMGPGCGCSPQRCSLQGRARLWHR